ncbi:MAG: RNA polymerase factor sigma-32 [Thermodesulfobacteriota bacterium]|nr:RNA polymerase factor sigma-32 [Thermodesulfobacteriota bacterium]
MTDESSASAKPAHKAAPAPKGPKALAPVSNAGKSLVKYDPLQRYLKEVSRYNLLTREQEIELGKRVQEEGDEEAAYILATSNLRLVVKIALEFQRVWMQNLLDLIQEGNIGLMHAVHKFDPYKNVKFSYYASFWIKAYILKFVMDNWRLVKIGTTQNQRKLFFRLKKEKQALIDQGFEPRPKLLAERLGVPQKEVINMEQRLDMWDLSLDEPVSNDSDTQKGDLLDIGNIPPVDEQVGDKALRQLVGGQLVEFKKTLTPRERDIFKTRIYTDQPMTLQDIGERYAISRERVRQLEVNIIKKMRDFFKEKIPDFDQYTTDTN